MASVTLEQVNENILSLNKKMDDIMDIIHESNRNELAESARKAHRGEGNWHKLEDV